MSHHPEDRDPDSSAKTSPPASNQAILEAMRQVEEIQCGMAPTPAGDTLALIREARDGAMWDDQPLE